jgi:predicted ATP-grasp superfamily ATP-dependent carboligase
VLNLKLPKRGKKMFFFFFWGDGVITFMSTYWLQFQEFLEIVWPTWRNLSESELGMLAILAPSGE